LRLTSHLEIERERFDESAVAGQKAVAAHRFGQLKGDLRAHGRYMNAQTYRRIK